MKKAIITQINDRHKLRKMFTDRYTSKIIYAEHNPFSRTTDYEIDIRDEATPLLLAGLNSRKSTKGEEKKHLVGQCEEMAMVAVEMGEEELLPKHIRNMFLF